MKGMPLHFDFEGNGVLDLEFILKNKDFITATAAVSSYFVKKNYFLNNCFGEPTSVLDSARISSWPTSSSTLSSSHCGGAGGAGGAASTDTAGVAAVSDPNPSPKWRQDFTTATSSNAGGADSELVPTPSLEIGASGGGNPEKLAMEDWESVLSEPAAVFPSQEQSFLRWVMGDVEDPAMGNLNKVLQIGGAVGSTAAEFDFSGGFGVVEQGFGGDQFGSSFMGTVPTFPDHNRSSAEKIGLPSNPISSNMPTIFKFSPNSHNPMQPPSISNNLGAIALHHQPAFDSSAEIKPPIFNSQLLINQYPTEHAQNPSSLFPPLCTQQEHNICGPPAKRHNPGMTGGPEPGTQVPKLPLMDTGQQELFIGRQQALPHHLQLLPHYLQQRLTGPGPKTKIGSDEVLHCQQQQKAILDQLYKAAELVQTGNPLLAQGILARLNHQLSPIGNPFDRAAFYYKEALQLLLQTNNNPSATTISPFSLVFKIGAYKSFSEISPLIQFANFTCNQAILEVLEGFDRIHIVDFSIGFGGQWASLMQELALRTGGAPSLKITAFTSSSTCDQLELSLTRENLIQFASEISIPFEFEAISIDSLNSSSWLSLPFHVQENEVVAVNLPIASLANYQLSAPSILCFVKQLSPRIVVSVDRGCDRSDLPFANHIIHALQSYSNLIESLDAVNVNMDALQKIERFLLQPGIEKIVMGRVRSPEKTQHWRALFLSSGFLPLTFSNFTESQAECVVKRTPVRGFQVEKRQSSLVLCWQRKELISVSAWRC